MSTKASITPISTLCRRHADLPATARLVLVYLVHEHGLRKPFCGGTLVVECGMGAGLANRTIGTLLNAGLVQYATHAGRNMYVLTDHQSYCEPGSPLDRDCR